MRRDQVDWPEAGRKSWVTRRENQVRIARKRRRAALKAWETRTDNS